MRDIASIVLAAGKGTRMKSGRPKVLHTLAGRSMLGWVLDVLATAGVARGVVVLSDELDSFSGFLAQRPALTVAIQEARQGTGDAAAAASFAFTGVARPAYARGRLYRGVALASRSVIICAGDTPALDPDLITRFVDECEGSGAAVGVLGMRVPDPTGYGRCVTAGGSLVAIVEERDATPDQKRIDVCNSGVIWARTAELFPLLDRLTPNNSQKEYYLTDCVAAACAAGLSTTLFVTDDWQSFAGVNDRRQLAAVETVLVRRALAALMASGVTVRLPETVYVEPGVRGGADSEVEPHAYLAGATTIGSHCRIGSGARLEAVQVGDGAKIGAGSILSGVSVSPGERVPPLSVRINPGIPTRER